MLPAVFTAEELLRWLEDRAEEQKNTEMRDNARKYAHVIYALAEARSAHALAKTEEQTCPEKAKEEEAGISTVKFNAEELLRWIETLAEKHKKPRMGEKAREYVQVIMDQEMNTEKGLLELQDSWWEETNHLKPWPLVHLFIIRAAMKAGEGPDKTHDDTGAGEGENIPQEKTCPKKAEEEITEVEPPKAERNEKEADISTDLKGCVAGYEPEYAVKLFTWSEYLAEEAEKIITWSEYLTGKADEPTTDAPHEDEAVISTDLKGCVEGYKPENETQDEPNEEAASISAYLKGYVEACPEETVELFTRSEYIAQKEEEITEVNAVIPQDEPNDVNTVKLKDKLTTSL
jgi:hypothetical protein